VTAAGTRDYAVVTAAYWGFTLTDGALRMLVLLHFHRLGYSPFSLALLFLLYEAAGVAANLAGGWLAARFGVTRMLAAGLALQVGGFLMLAALPSDWGPWASVAWVVAAQGVCGIAKDLAKTASKSAIKLVAGEASGRLFRLVAWFTGSKNAMKGAGFFLGGALLELLGFAPALLAMAAGLVAVLVGVTTTLPPLAGAAKASRSARELFAKSGGVNLLAAARVFLFGARDVWFVVGLPVFLYAAGWNFAAVGAFLASWTIGYGAVQAAAPAFVRRSPDGLSAEVPAARAWALALALVPPAILAVLASGVASGDIAVAAGLCVFGAFFAVNSSLHSYLILAYAGTKKAAEDVGFYYAANALGRFGGTLLSGLLYGAGGIEACLWGAAAMLAACWATTLALPSDSAGPVPADRAH
jgi:predicted MFS family arabinose efflux permease